VSDRRVEVLIKAAVEDLQPLVTLLRAKGWPVEVRTEASPDLKSYVVTAVITVIPVEVQPL
jgi:hypothetical protein